ncbi:hypothetical protein [Streptomyces sp. SAI-127]|uniref:hypothetical protein n=1 Tax=Streptomyces sp. SAI-127 TaxID=2940543 RepID=UPI002474EF10|nr:hypothetical protein [Streptomyces sp. SAI-127]
MQEILRHTLDGRPAMAASLLDVVTEHGDTADLFGVCCAAAETARGALLALFPDAGTAPGDGWQLPPGLADQLAGDPHRLFAARFTTAYLNDDPVMAFALFQATEAAGYQDRTESICTLLAHVRGLALRAEQGPATPDPGGVPA